MTGSLDHQHTGRDSAFRYTSGSTHCQWRRASTKQPSTNRRNSANAKRESFSAARKDNARLDPDELSLAGMKVPGNLQTHHSPSAGNGGRSYNTRHAHSATGARRSKYNDTSVKPASARGHSRGSGTPLVTSAMIGVGAWGVPATPGSTKPPLGSHHLGASQAAQTLRETQAWPTDATRYHEEYYEKTAERAKPSQTRGTRDVEFEMETLNIAGEPEDDGAKFHAAKWYPDPKVVYDKPPRRPDVTKSSQPNFGGPAHAGGELITWYQDVSRGPAATKVWEDYENGKPPANRHSGGDAMGKKTSNLLFHGEEPDGAAADVLKSYNEVVYQGPPADLVSALAKETREIKAGWQIQNGPETFLVHRHPGAPGGPKDVPIPGVGYPGKWGAQVDDEYRFKKRRGDQKYFQNANDPDAKGTAEVLGVDRHLKPHLTNSHMKDTHGKQLDKHGRQPETHKVPGNLITYSNWLSDGPTNMDLYTKNKAHNSVWLQGVPVGSGVQRHSGNVYKSQVLLGYEYDSKLPAKQPKGGYRPQHNNRKTHSPTARDLPVERHWTRRKSHMHPFRKVRVPYGLHEDGGPGVYPPSEEIPEALEVEKPCQYSKRAATSHGAARKKEMLAGVLQKSNPAFETSSGTAFVDHTFEAFKLDYETALARRTGKMSARDFAVSLQAPKPFHPEQSCGM